MTTAMPVLPMSKFGSDSLEGSLYFGDDFKVESTPLKTLYEMWKAARKDGARWPTRTAIDLIEAPSLVPYIFMLDRHPEGSYHWRMVGSSIVRLRGNDPTGLAFEGEHATSYDPTLGKFLDLAVELEAPLRGLGRTLVPDKSHVFSETLVLPTCECGDKVDGVVGCQIYSNAQGQIIDWPS